VTSCSEGTMLLHIVANIWPVKGLADGNMKPDVVRIAR
jgi:hypothetical protein